MCIVVVSAYTAYVYFISNRITTEDKESAEVYYSLAVSDYKGRLFTSALDNAKKALRLNPAETEYYLLICDVYEKKSRYDIEYDFLNSIEGSIRNEESIKRRYVRVNYSLENYGEVERIGKDFVNFDNPQMEELYYIDSLLKDGNIDMALPYLNACVKCDSDIDTDLIIRRFVVLQQNTDQFISFVDHLNGECKNAPDLDEMLSLMNLLKDMGSSESDLRVEVEKANIALELGLYKVVINMLEPNIDKYDTYWEPNWILSSAYFHSGNMDKAEAYLNVANSLNRFDYHIPWLSAEIYELQGNNADAYEEFVKAITLAGDDAYSVTTAYINMLVKDSQHSLALSVYDQLQNKLLETGSYIDYVTTVLNKADLCLGLQKYDEVETELNKLSEIDEDYIRASQKNDDYYMLLFELNIYQENFEEARGIVSSGVFFDNLYQIYCEAILSYVKSDYDNARVKFNVILDMDCDGFLTERSKKYLNLLK